MFQDLDRLTDSRHGPDLAKKRFGSKSGLLVRTTLTFAILIYFALKLDWQRLGAQLGQSDPVWLLTACLLLGVAYLLAAVRWWLLLKVQAIFLPLKVVTALTLIGQFFNAFLLGAMGGDVVKMFYIVKYACSNKTQGTLSVIMDRMMGLLVLLSIALVALPWQAHVLIRSAETKGLAWVLIALFAAIITGGAMLALTPFQKLPEIFHRLWHRIPRHEVIARLHLGFLQHGRSLRLTLAALACSFVIYLIVVLAGYFIALAIHLEVTYLQMLVILALVICLISLPISIGGHGVREGAFVLLFAAFGIISIDTQTGLGQESAVLFSLLFFALVSVWSLVGGVVYLGFRHSYSSY